MRPCGTPLCSHPALSVPTLRPHLYLNLLSPPVCSTEQTLFQHKCASLPFHFFTDADGVAEKPFKKCFLKSNCLFIVYKERILFEKKRLQYLSGFQIRAAVNLFMTSCQVERDDRLTWKMHLGNLLLRGITPSLYPFNCC